MAGGYRVPLGIFWGMWLAAIPGLAVAGFDAAVFVLPAARDVRVKDVARVESRLFLRSHSASPGFVSVCVDFF